MNPRADRSNRAVLTLIGLILLVLGAAGVVLSFNWVQPLSDFVGRHVLPARFTSAVAQLGWFWWVVAAAAVVLGLLGLVWILAQLRTDRVGALRMETDASFGQSTLLTRGLVDALAGEVEGYGGVRTADARFIGKPARPVAVVNVEIDEASDVGAVRRRVETSAVAHLRQSLETAIPVQVQIVVDSDQ